MSQNNSSQELIEAITQGRLAEFLDSHPGEMYSLPSEVHLPPREDGKRIQFDGRGDRVDYSDVRSWENVLLEGAIIFTRDGSVSFRNCDLQLCIITTTALSQGFEFNGCTLIEVEFNCHRVEASQTDFTAVTFSHSDSLQLNVGFRSTFAACIFANKRIERCSLDTVSFQHCQWLCDTWDHVTCDHVSFTETLFHSDMSFIHCSFRREIEVDRVFFDSLGDKMGGLTAPTIRKFKVHDPIAELRLMFGGWMFFLHATAMTLFFTPYVLFILKKLAQTWFIAGTATPSEWLLTSIVRYGLWGNHSGEFWTHYAYGFARLLTTIVFIFYNAARIRALVKTKSLEHERSVTGIWPAFSLDDRVTVWKAPSPEWLTYRKLAQFVKVCTVLAVICGCVHAWTLLTTPVPREHIAVLQ